jgi:hypothetical protein
MPVCRGMVVIIYDAKKQHASFNREKWEDFADCGANYAEKIDKIYRMSQKSYVRATKRQGTLITTYYH